MRRSRAGRLVLTFVAAVTGISPFLADWNETHIYNHNWPPHAKFHNAQTISMAALLSTASLFFIWRTRSGVRTDLPAAVVLTSLYWASQSAAFAFPGVAWTDPDLLKPGQSLDQFPHQVYLQLALYAMIATGASLVVAGRAQES